MNKETKKAVITGVTGKDGAYLAQLLLEKGYTMYGTYHRSNSLTDKGVANIYFQARKK